MLQHFCDKDFGVIPIIYIVSILVVIVQCVFMISELHFIYYGLSKEFGLFTLRYSQVYI